jgi:hypothetical protein
LFEGFFKLTAFGAAFGVALPLASLFAEASVRFDLPFDFDNFSS